MFLFTACLPTFALPKPKAPYEAKPNRGRRLRMTMGPVGTEESEGKIEKGFSSHVLQRNPPRRTAGPSRQGDEGMTWQSERSSSLNCARYVTTR